MSSDGSVDSFDYFAHVYTLGGVDSPEGVWYRYRTTPTTIDRVLTDIRRVYPSVLDIDRALIATWDSNRHPKDSKV